MLAQPPVAYRLESGGRFVIENYNWAKAFSNFFPGIAGEWGIPLWTYYVSRNQAVCSMGVGDKDRQILEFHSFNKACLTVGGQGFRTFLKIGAGSVYEPFRRTTDRAVRQTLTVTAGELELVERNSRLGVEIAVTYVPLAGMPIGAMLREVRVRNLRARAVRIEWIDGAARILPYGLNQQHIKFIPRHIEAMMGVIESAGACLFRLKQTAADSEKVGLLTGGNFYFSLPVAGAKRGSVVYDPAAVFGDSFNFERPWLFEAAGARGVQARAQMRENRTPCAFTVMKQTLPARGEVRLLSLVGYAPDDAALRGLVSTASKKDFFENQRAENREILGRIMSKSFTVSNVEPFDAYCGQNFLDNVIRGGLPVVLKSRSGPGACYVFSRQNGDLERDYHHFVLDPTYWSQGTGHYRSVLQNRRMDTWFFPEVEDINLAIFMNLMQLDGYNPLEVRGLSFRAERPERIRAILRARVASRVVRDALIRMTARNFTPGEFLMAVEPAVRGRKRAEAVLREVLLECRENEMGGLHEGFWVDHWTYTLDLIDAYLMVYPDRLGELLLGRAAYTFFDDPDVILPRDEKCVDAGGKIRRYGAVARNPEKLARVKSRRADAWKVRTRNGEGRVYLTTLLVKLLCLAANRIATLDPSGVGMDMEADKPGWNDSMNGLPGLFGSALCESLELLRLCRFLRSSLSAPSVSASGAVAVYDELARFIRRLARILDRRLASNAPVAAMRYWDESNHAKEEYRARTNAGVSGRETRMRVRELTAFIDRCQRLLEQNLRGTRRAPSVSPDGVPYTYFVHDVTKHRPLNRTSRAGLPLVKPVRFKRLPVKLFLEGPVHYMKVFPEEAGRVYSAVRRSEIFDRKLKMYKSCEPMTGESYELGRAVGAYPRGWIENESIYLHMEYKYLLEILRSGLCPEFFRDAKTTLMPFLDPAVYGRSTLEGASFIVSSAYADRSSHGQAFQPRLSGLTSEFVHMWTLMVAGPDPFRVGRSGDLELALRPRIADWLFTTRAETRNYFDERSGWKRIEFPRNNFAFQFLGRCLVIYHNPARLSTWLPACQIASYLLTDRRGRVTEHPGPVLPSPAAQSVRSGNIFRMDVQLATE